MFSKFCYCAVDLHFDVGNSCVHHLGHFLILHVLKPCEHEQFALVFVQQCHGAMQESFLFFHRFAVVVFWHPLTNLVHIHMRILVFCCVVVVGENIPCH